MVRVLKGAAWTLCSLMLAALIAGGLSFVIPCGNGEILMDHGDILRLSIPGIGAGISFLFLLVGFRRPRTGTRRKKTAPPSRNRGRTPSGSACRRRCAYGRSLRT